MFAFYRLLKILMSLNGCRIEVKSPVKVRVKAFVPDLKRKAGTKAS
jgi:hypothetical protein